MTDDALAANPSARLVAAFRRIHAERMQGLPFVNPALDVEAVDFAPWQGLWLGVMVTPWSINLMLLPHDRAAWKPLAAGTKRRYRFAAGDYDFVAANDEAIGEFLVCSLFSPALEFADHATARLTAQCARVALFDATHAESPPQQSARPLADLKENLAAPMSKRDFLRGRFIEGERGDRG
jgi:[NiFe] hydrogenase assembly HybE family chaperone